MNSFYHQKKKKLGMHDHDAQNNIYIYIDNNIGCAFLCSVLLFFKLTNMRREFLFLIVSYVVSYIRLYYDLMSDSVITCI